MKHLVLAVAFLTMSCLTALAGERPTKESNAAAIQQGRAALSSKIAAFESSLKANNTTQANALATEIHGLLRTGMSHTMNEIALAPKEDRKTINVRYLAQEEAAHSFYQMLKDVPGNGNKLVNQAKSFLKTY